MTISGLLLVGLTAVLQSAANLLLRGGVLRAGGLSFSSPRVTDQAVALASEPMFVIGVFLYGAAAVVWFSVLSVEDLSRSYPMLVGLSFIIVGAGAALFFSEQISWQKLAGMSTILVGILLVARAEG